MKAIATIAAAAALLPMTAMAAPDTKQLDPAVLAEKARVADQAERDTLSRQVARGSGEAMLDLASILEQGDAAGPIDRPAAMDLYQKAADKGEPIGRQKMCLAYLLGEGRPKDVVKAAPYCNALGVVDYVGLYWAGYDYQFGISGPKDEGEAMSLFVQASTAGSGDAAVSLGLKAIELNKLDAARQWFRRGVYFGSADAMEHLAAMTEAGQGGAVDVAEAAWLYQQAAARGNADAAERLKTLYAGPDLPTINPFGANKTAPIMTHTYTGKNGPVQEQLNFSTLMGFLTNSFPPAALGSQVEGRATIECYVAGDHSIDACIISHESPIGYGYGPTLETLFNGHMSLVDKDSDGKPPANCLFKMTVNWLIGR